MGRRTKRTKRAGMIKDGSDARAPKVAVLGVSETGPCEAEEPAALAAGRHGREADGSLSCRRRPGNGLCPALEGLVGKVDRIEAALLRLEEMVGPEALYRSTKGFADCLTFVANQQLELGVDLEQIIESLEPIKEIDLRPAVAELREGQNKITESLARAEGRIERIEGAVDEVLRETKAVQTRTDSLVKSVTGQAGALRDLDDAAEHNRNVTQAVARKLDGLSRSAIERETDKYAREMARLYGELNRVAEKGDDGIRDDLAAEWDQLERFLESRGLRLINPQPGAEPDPRRTEIISREETLRREMDGTIAHVHWPGLVRGDRVVRRAQVSVYEVKEEPNQIEEKDDETHD